MNTPQAADYALLSDESISLHFAYEILESAEYAPQAVEAFLQRNDFFSSEAFFLKISDEFFPLDSLKHILKATQRANGCDSAVRDAIAERSDLSPEAMWALGLPEGVSRENIEITCSLLASGVENDRFRAINLSDYLFKNVDKWLHSELDECGGECECYDIVIANFIAEHSS